ncbi:2-hydroxyacyl-CoA dehydratase [bacterium]|nr:2-hydroxyacyl-CoA dehydratase [bacterium]
MQKTAAFTTTVPVEVILASGFRPLDLNNIFVTDGNPSQLVEKAEFSGFAGSSCAWIKGLYSVLVSPELNKDFGVFIAVTEGDCSNAKVLEQIVAMETGIRTFIFNFPYQRDIAKMRSEIERFADFLGTDYKNCVQVWNGLKNLRKKLKIIDETSYLYPGSVTGEENHLFLVSSSDFCGDPDAYEQKVDDFIKELEHKKRFTDNSRKKIAYLGVPPIVPIHSFLESRNATVIFNEIQREFAMLDEYSSIEEQYINYTYPYSAAFRFEKAIAEIERRRPDGIIHYVQSFCHRQLEDIILRQLLKKHGLNIPLLTLEFDKPADKIDARVATRIEAFLETI